MQITAAMVKELRKRTGAGMMECKKFLVQAQGDTAQAVKLLREAGQVKASKRDVKVAAEGTVVIVNDPNDPKRYTLLEVNCETDFVARGDLFQAFVRDVCDVIVKAQPADLETLLQCPSSTAATVEKARTEVVAAIGENVQLRRFQAISLQGDCAAAYSHGKRIAVVVDMRGGDEDLAKDIALHVAASSPQCIDQDGVDEALLQSERDIYIAQAQQSGKPDDIVEKMVAGKMRKFLDEITLLGQAFVKDPDKKVSALLKEHNAEVLGFWRYGLGEGIEKKQENFAEEVMQQVKASGGDQPS